MMQKIIRPPIPNDSWDQDCNCRCHCTSTSSLISTWLTDYCSICYSSPLLCFLPKNKMLDLTEKLPARKPSLLNMPREGVKSRLPQTVYIPLRGSLSHIQRYCLSVLVSLCQRLVVNMIKWRSEFCQVAVTNILIFRPTQLSVFYLRLPPRCW
jgi:hypothetical protein